MNMAQARAMEETARRVTELTVECAKLALTVAERFYALEQRVEALEHKRGVLSLGAVNGSKLRG